MINQFLTYYLNVKILTGHNLWNITRATRQIGSAIDACKIFKDMCEGKKNTRKLQKKFGKKLASSGIKTSGLTRKDSGGDRTWMGLLKTFGLWYEDQHRIIVFTPAGKTVARGGREAMMMMEKQILTFQYPNRTQEHWSQLMNKKFQIFPYRFLVKLLLLVDYLTVQEIALFALQVSSDKELPTVVKNINLFRKTGKLGNYESHRKKYKKNHDKDKYKKYVEDLADTFKNHMESLPHISSRQSGNKHELYIESGHKKEWKKKIDEYDLKYPFNKTYDDQDRKFFVERYGRLVGKKKASVKTSSPVTKDQTNIRKIQEAIVQIMENYPKITSKKLIDEIHLQTYLSTRIINNILARYPELVNSNYDAFERKYLQVAGDGKRWKEFEEMTAEIFKRMGFSVGKQKEVKFSKNQSGFLDGYITFNTNSGIIDAKSGKGFSCGNMAVGIMKDYIKKAQKFPFQLEFFGYVYGRKFSNNSGFERIQKESKTNGFRISAMNLLNLIKSVESGKISKEEVWNLFKSNGEVEYW